MRNFSLLGGLAPYAVSSLFCISSSLLCGIARHAASSPLGGIAPYAAPLGGIARHAASSPLGGIAPYAESSLHIAASHRMRYLRFSASWRPRAVCSIFAFLHLIFASLRHRTSCGIFASWRHRTLCGTSWRHLRLLAASHLMRNLRSISRHRTVCGIFAFLHLIFASLRHRTVCGIYRPLRFIA
jgi:hypothetical protein